MKILFFGSDVFAIPTLHALAESEHTLLGVVAQPDKPAGRGQKLTPCPGAVVANDLKLPLFQPPKISDPQAIEELLNLKPDCLVVVAYGKYLPKALVDAPEFKAVNVHPSLLPKYRGAAPMPWAILNGDKKTGVSTMTVAEEMDAGDIYLQTETTIDEIENAEQLSNRLGELGAELLLKTLEGLEKKTLKAKPQDATKIVLAPKLEKEMGHLDWREKAVTLYNKVRAFTPWPGTFCKIENKILKIWEAAPIENAATATPGTVLDNRQGLIVACGQGGLCLLEVQLEGKKRMSAGDFLKGHPVAIGTILK
ncbi:MAG: methionyl-tRNA formyltransferase [Deltaproteobacteria bacterium]|nr:methionyl-tRNA formyltransferase [Deltaproteobacteria bacterium]